jgi:hypothetical protein
MYKVQKKSGNHIRQGEMLENSRGIAPMLHGWQNWPPQTITTDQQSGILQEYIIPDLTFL